MLVQYKPIWNKGFSLCPDFVVQGTHENKLTMKISQITVHCASIKYTVKTEACYAHCWCVHRDKFVSIIICTHQQHGKKALCHEMDL